MRTSYAKWAAVLWLALILLLHAILTPGPLSKILKNSEQGAEIHDLLNSPFTRPYVF